MTMSSDPLSPRPLGRTDLQVTPLCVGCAPLGDMPDTFGYAVPEGQAHETLRAAYAGRMNGGEILSYEARHDGGTPRTFSVTAHDKGANTNVTLSFDVTA